MACAHVDADTTATGRASCSSTWRPPAWRTPSTAAGTIARSSIDDHDERKPVHGLPPTRPSLMITRGKPIYHPCRMPDGKELNSPTCRVLPPAETRRHARQPDRRLLPSMGLMSFPGRWTAAATNTSSTSNRKPDRKITGIDSDSWEPTEMGMTVVLTDAPPAPTRFSENKLRRRYDTAGRAHRLLFTEAPRQTAARQERGVIPGFASFQFSHVCSTRYRPAHWPSGKNLGPVLAPMDQRSRRMPVSRLRAARHTPPGSWRGALRQWRRTGPCPGHQETYAQHKVWQGSFREVHPEQFLHGTFSKFSAIL